MAKDKGKTFKNRKTLQPQEGKEVKKNGALFTLMAFLVAIAIILVVFGSAFFIVIRNNINGLADRYRKDIQSIPILKWALPEPPDPESPEFLTDEEIKNKYMELRKLRDELNEKLEDSNKTISELQKYKQEQESNIEQMETEKSELQSQQLKLEEDRLLLEQDRQSFTEMVAAHDKEGFIEFYEKEDAETTQKIYTEIMQQEKVDQEVSKFVKIYASMDAGAAAGIFEEMGDEKLQMVVDILKNMKQEIAAEIISEMDAKFAAKVTEKLSAEYIK